MRGTDQLMPRCVAFEGNPGGAARCQIYDRRPSSCRALSASFEDGVPSDQCDRARIRHGLPVLSLADWRPASFIQS